MKKFLLIVVACLFCISCGVKDEPEYKSLIVYNKAIYLV
jgi:hypothetical protein